MEYADEFNTYKEPLQVMIFLQWYKTVYRRGNKTRNINFLSTTCVTDLVLLTRIDQHLTKVFRNHLGAFQIKTVFKISRKEDPEQTAPIPEIIRPLRLTSVAITDRPKVTASRVRHV